MDSLANYGSDDDYEDLNEEKQTNLRPNDGAKTIQSSNSGRQEDANYEEVQMELSEESNDGSRNSNNKDSSGDDKRNNERNRNSPNNKRRDDLKNRKNDNKNRERSRSRDKRDSRDDERVKDRRDYKYKYGSKLSRDDRNDRSYKKDSYRDRRYRRSSSRDRKRSNSRDRRRSDSRDRRRSSSRERKYSRSPRRDRSKRSRSRSRGKYSSSRRYGYQKNNDVKDTSGEGGNSKDRFFMPGITGKYREQIEKRKLLWQKKESQQNEKEPSMAPIEITNPSTSSTSRGTKIWETTTFAQDQDGKVANKFKRLMGIKGQSESNVPQTTDIIKKQEEMFSSMEQQYEVARTATHTMRGVGLGFSSSYPR